MKKNSNKDRARSKLMKQSSANNEKITPPCAEELRSSKNTPVSKDRVNESPQQLWLEYGEILCTYAVGLCANNVHFTGNDLASELFLRINDKAHLIFSQPKENRIFYLMRMTRNLYLSMKGKEKMPIKAAEKLSFNDKCDSNEESFIQQDSLNYWEQIIKEVAGERNTQIIMLHIRGYTFKEIAGILGGNLTMTSAKAAYHQAIKKVAQKC